MAWCIEVLMLIEDERDAGGVAAVGPQDGSGGMKLMPSALNEDGAMRWCHCDSTDITIQEVVFAV